jgi:hypothetical protein
MRGMTGMFLLAATLAASALMPAAIGHAATNFDGQWSVVVYTSNGPCEASNRFSGQIVNGEISYAYGSLEVTGRVEPGGTVLVQVTYGSAHGEAHGHMTATHGGGTWSGDSPDGHCTGTWSATRPGTP